MGVFKEEAHTLETIERKQTQIYEDAADYGYPYNTNNVPSDVTNLIDMIAEFKAIDKEFPEETPFIRNRLQWGNHDNKGPTGVSLDVIIFWEKDEGRYHGTKYSITFDKTPKHPSLFNKECDAFISVYSERYSEEA